MVGELAQRADVPMPKIYFIDTAQPNAFATGRNPRHAAVAVTRGILESLSRDELAGVLAHELAHIKNRDTLTMAIAATIGSAIGMLANFGLFFGSRNDRGNMLTTLITIFLAPLAAGIVQMAISRTREFSADRDGAAISGRPVALAHALQKIQALAGQRPMRSVQRNPASAPLFIVNPLTGHGVVDLFRTHPRTEERVRRLMAIANQQKQVPLPAGSGPWG
jgi:heat shock protein HtpX